MQYQRGRVWSSLFYFIGLPLTVMTIGIIGLYYFKAEALVWHWLASHTPLSAQASEAGLGLNKYEVMIEAKKVEGVSDDLSGITYNHETNTLFSVLNGDPLIVELDLEGNLIRQITVQGVVDMEDITHIEGNKFVVVDEFDQRVILLEIDKSTTELDATNAPQIGINIDGGNNKNIEGVIWDAINKRLLVSKEKKPMRIYEIRGFIDNFENDTDKKSKINIHELPAPKMKNLAMRDLSAITVDKKTGHLLLLSDESRLAAEYDAAGNLLSTLSLWPSFHGLKKPAKQAEGIAIGKNREVYVVSEPDLFYVFKPKPLCMDITE